MAEGSSADASRRKSLKVAVAALCTEVGYGLAEDAALETLSEMIQSYITEVGRSAQAFTELACRTRPMVSDVSVALIEMGCNIQSLQAYAKRPNKTVFMPPSASHPTPTPRTLQAGDKQSHPPHIPDHLPQFPDPHTYIRSLTHKKPVSEYQLIREKAASQKRDVERALTKFIAKTSETENLFSDDPYAYPLIACKPKPLPYLDALLPKDHDLDAQEDTAEDQKKKQAELAAAGALKDPLMDVGAPLQPELTVQMATNKGQENLNDSITDPDGLIDNPYLREIKMPKFKVNKKSKY